MNIDYLKIIMITFALISSTVYTAEQAVHALQTQAKPLQRLCLDAADITEFDFFNRIKELLQTGQVNLGQSNILFEPALTCIEGQLGKNPTNTTLLFAQRILKDLQKNPRILNSFNPENKPATERTPRRKPLFKQPNLTTIAEETE